MPSAAGMSLEQDKRISEAVEREQSRLRSFIQRRVGNPEDVEDILQDAFYQLVETVRLVRPVEHIGPWLFRVIRNRVVDFYRRKKADVSMDEPVEFGEKGGLVALSDLLPSPDDGPEAAYARKVLLDELGDALDELPLEQREVFLAHEIEGRSFQELADVTGLSVNTLLSRKHYAVLQLRRRLRTIYDEFQKG